MGEFWGVEKGCGLLSARCLFGLSASSKVLASRDWTARPPLRRRGAGGDFWATRKALAMTPTNGLSRAPRATGGRG